ncbi:MAG: adenylate/guanylate cyclase domain-containing protein [Acidimicrobiia bacterium]|nr:adenylate/guanylate cyclase domain-containing protein [Acidimicrobiia bacterium]
MQVPEVRYATTEDDVRIAYQVFGEGPPVVYVGPFFNHLEVQWEQPVIARVFERLAPYLRVILIENRGTGLSDRIEGIPTLEERTTDIEAVVDAVGIERFSLIGMFAGGQMCIDFAARHPDAVERLVLANARVGRALQAEADALKPDAPGELAYGTEYEQKMIETARHLGSELTEDDLSALAAHSPSAFNHPEYVQWLPRFERMWGDREMIRRQAASIAPLEASDIAPTVQAPTLLTHTADNGIIHVGYGRLLNQLIPNSTLLEFEGRDQHYWLAPNWREIIDAHLRFIGQSEIEVPVDRRFAVVVFTDIVGSTESSMSAGDVRWRELLDIHDTVAQRVVGRNSGTMVKLTGDGVLAIFESPSNALQAATELERELRAVGIPIRAGLHAGEIELRGDDVSGSVVNLAARVMESAADGEVATTASMRDLMLGSAFEFESIGSRTLRGFNGEWHLYRVGLP